jgi:hypothetical protein
MSYEAISENQIQNYIDRVKQGGLSELHQVYQELAQKGYTYAELADGVLTGDSLTGQVALDFLQDTAQKGWGLGAGYLQGH